MITKDKVIEISCIIDEFDKNLEVELAKTCNYLPMTVLESTIVTARADYRKAHTCRKMLQGGASCPPCKQPPTHK